MSFGYGLILTLISENSVSVQACKAVQSLSYPACMYHEVARIKHVG